MGEHVTGELSRDVALDQVALGHQGGTPLERHVGRAVVAHEQVHDRLAQLCRHVEAQVGQHGGQCGSRNPVSP